MARHPAIAGSRDRIEGAVCNAVLWHRNVSINAVFNKLKSDFSLLVEGKPGSRFRDHHRRHRQSEGRATSAWKTAAYLLLGATLLTAGLVLSIPPGLPGFLLWIPGLGLLVARLRVLAALLDRGELWLRKIAERLGSRFR